MTGLLRVEPVASASQGSGRGGRRRAGWWPLMVRGPLVPCSSPGSVWLLLVDVLHPVPLLFVTHLSPVCPLQSLPSPASSPPAYGGHTVAARFGFCFLEAEQPFPSLEWAALGGLLQSSWLGPGPKCWSFQGLSHRLGVGVGFPVVPREQCLGRKLKGEHDLGAGVSDTGVFLLAVC